jgi:hypothetical protein
MIKNRDKLFLEHGVEDHDLAFAVEKLKQSKDTEYETMVVKH